MCLTCGCMRPHDDMGTPDNRIIEDLEKSAAASNVTLDQSVQNRIKTVEVAKAETEHHHG
jgi:hypothetical protein